jgi:transcriptional regulator with XRE-family HTH domain
MSQNAFAARFGILPSTLRDWEQNRRHPDGAARGWKRTAVRWAAAEKQSKRF